MKKVIYIFYCLFVTLIIKAQEDCPPGYAERSVKCNGTIVKRCIPENYSCNRCWNVESPPCPDRTSGCSMGYDTYQRALEIAKKDANGNNWHNGKCTWCDNRTNIIYLNDSSLCDGINTATVSRDDFRAKFNSLLDDWKFSLAEAISRYRGYTGFTWPPEPGQVLNGYSELIENQQKEINKLEIYNHSIASKNLDKLNDAYENFQNQFDTFKSSISFYESPYTDDDKTNNSWIKLPDGTSYKILPNGMYSFFDGVDQVETVPAHEGKLNISKHQSQSLTNIPDNSKLSKDDLKDMEDAINQLKILLDDLKKSDDVDQSQISDLQNQLRNLQQQIDNSK